MTAGAAKGAACSRTWVWDEFSCKAEEPPTRALDMHLKEHSIRCTLILIPYLHELRRHNTMSRQAPIKETRPKTVLALWTVCQALVGWEISGF